MEIGAAKPIEKWRKELGIVRHAFKFLRLVSELLWLAACSLQPAQSKCVSESQPMTLFQKST